MSLKMKRITLRRPQLSKLSISKRLTRQSSNYRVIEHTTRCSHTRHYPAGAEPSQHNSLRLSIKQYIPHSNPNPSPTDITILAAHANGFPKELYEPLWDDLLSTQNHHNNIRSIWIADQYNQGQSGVLNETILGPDPSWWDHSRDLLKLINDFQDDMPHPIVGIGHSMGGTQLAHLSLMHPRLLDALILIDPVIQIENPGYEYALASTYRRDLWNSRAEAAEAFASSKFYQKWDSRVLQKWLQYGLRDLPTEQYPLNNNTNKHESAPRPVTLTTPIPQEIYHFQRPAYTDPRLLNCRTRTQEMPSEDIDATSSLYRPESAQLFHSLPHLPPEILYIFGASSPLSPPSARQHKVDVTGTGPGGSGGKERGMVHDVTLECGHLVPMEKTGECAAVVGEFLGYVREEWLEGEERRRDVRREMGRQEWVGVNGAWRESVGEPPKRGRGRGK